MVGTREDPAMLPSKLGAPCCLVVPLQKKCTPQKLSFYQLFTFTRFAGPIANPGQSQSVFTCRAVPLKTLAKNSALISFLTPLGPRAPLPKPVNYS
jgi:hypothetical protein